MLPFHLTYRSAAFCFFAFLFCSRTTAQIQPMVPKINTRAVVIGISSYLNISKLRFAHKDAESFVEYLRSAAGGNVPEDHIKLLTNEKATQGGIGGALTWLMMESQEGDLAIIYFSGHGDVETQMTNMGYLLAYDANKTTYMAGGAIPIYTLQAIITNLSVAKKVQVLVITDACHSGNLAGAESGGAKTTALAMQTQFANEVKIMSCGPDEVSLEDERWGGGHSVFSYYLLEGLRGMADANEDHEVSLRELDRFLEDSVQRATAALRPQTPVTFGSGSKTIAKVDPATLAALLAKNNPAKVATANPASSKNGQAGRSDSDTTTMRLYHAFEEAMSSRHLLNPEKGSAYSLYQQIKDQPIMKPYKNLMLNDLAAALQEDAQKAINDYISADPREMRRRWSLDDTRYKLYPKYLEKAAELLGKDHFSYNQLKAKEYYFTGLNLRFQGERLGNLATKDSLFNAAIIFQKKTLKLDSTAAYAYNELGHLSIQFKAYKESALFFNNAIRFSPGWVMPWANLCRVYIEMNNLEMAEKCGLKAIAIDSMSALAHNNLGVVYTKKGESEKGAYHYNKTIELSQEYVLTYFNLGLYYYNNSEFELADQQFTTYKNHVPDDPDVYQNLGEVAIKLSKPIASEVYFLKAIELDSKYSKAYLSLSDLYLSLNEQGKSDKMYSEYVRLKPDDPTGEGNIHLALKYSQNTSEALRYLEAAFQKGFNDEARLNSEPKLANLRTRSDYKRLLLKYLPEKKE